MRDVVIGVQNLGKKYQLGRNAGQGGAGYRTLRETLSDTAQNLFRSNRSTASTEEFWALRDVSFEVKQGDVVGIIGRNGAGKSTLLKILSRITDPTKGRVEITGRVASLLEVGTGFHQELTGRENIFLNGAILGMSRAEIKAKFDEIVAFAEVEKFLDTPVKRYSSGMYVRLAFAVAAHLDPDILVIDEVLAVGDAEFQRKCIGKMRDVSRGGRTVLFVSHNLSLISSLCRDAIVLRGGEVAAVGPADEVVSRYLERLKSSAGSSLADRSDREGDGLAKLCSVELTDQYGAAIEHAFSGGALNVQLAYTSRAPGSRVNAAISCFSARGEKVFHLDNVARGIELKPLAEAGNYVCRLPKLPLAPGHYFLNVMLLTDRGIADHVSAAASFDVLPGDYFQTGKIAESHGSLILTEHSWS